MRQPMSIGKCSIPPNARQRAGRVISHAQRQPVAAAADDVHAQVAELEHRRLLGPIVQRAGHRRRADHRCARPPRRPAAARSPPAAGSSPREPGRPSPEQQDRVRWIGPEAILALLQPVQARQRQPAVRTAQPLIPLRAPGRTPAAWSSGVTRRRAGTGSGAWWRDGASRFQAAGPPRHRVGAHLRGRQGWSRRSPPRPDPRRRPPGSRGVPIAIGLGQQQLAAAQADAPARGAQGRRRRQPDASSAPSIGSRSAWARSASAVTRKSARGGSVQSSISRGKSAVPRVVIGRHRRPCCERLAHAPPQEARVLAGLGVEPLRELLGAAFAQDAVEGRLVRHHRAGRG